MSAAAARRRKQLVAKAAAAGQDPITAKMDSLLASEDLSESTAYEALQLAQSQVRKCVISGNYTKATETYGYDVLVKLLEKGKAGVASQLMTLLVQVLTETHTLCDGSWIKKIQNLSELNLKAVNGISNNQVEQERLMKLHAKFLKSALGWSSSLGSIRFGAFEIHKLLADQLWTMSETQAEHESEEESEEEAGSEDYSKVGLQSDAITHYALAEDIDTIIANLSKLPGPTDEETAQNHACPPCAREAFLTRSILLLLSNENIRDAYKTISLYITKIETRDIEKLKKSYMSKTDGKSPSHPIFLSMLVESCRKNAKTGPLFTWAKKSFNSELSNMYKADVLKMYTNNIGKVYFNILPPPSMMATIENMMGMMSGAGGMNPAMMQQMMGGGM